MPLILSLILSLIAPGGVPKREIPNRSTALSSCPSVHPHPRPQSFSCMELVSNTGETGTVRHKGKLKCKALQWKLCDATLLVAPDGQTTLRVESGANAATLEHKVEGAKILAQNRGLRKQQWRFDIQTSDGSSAGFAALSRDDLSQWEGALGVDTNGTQHNTPLGAVQEAQVQIDGAASIDNAIHKRRGFASTKGWDGTVRTRAETAVDESESDDDCDDFNPSEEPLIMEKDHFLNGLSRAAYFSVPPEESDTEDANRETDLQAPEKKIKLWACLNVSEVKEINEAEETFTTKLRLYLVWRLPLAQYGEEELLAKARKRGTYYALSNDEAESILTNIPVPTIKFNNAVRLEVLDARMCLTNRYALLCKSHSRCAENSQTSPHLSCFLSIQLLYVSFLAVVVQ